MGCGDTVVTDILPLLQAGREKEEEALTRQPHWNRVPNSRVVLHVGGGMCLHVLYVLRYTVGVCGESRDTERLIISDVTNTILRLGQDGGSHRARM